MGYYTRVLTKREDCPSFDDLKSSLCREHPAVVLSLECGVPHLWEQLILANRDEVPIAAVERNPVVDGELGREEIEEFLEAIEDAEPESGVIWLTNFLQATRVVYAFQHLAGSESEAGFAALDHLRSLIWGRGQAILQSDGEGFSNEEGYTIVWQFSDEVSGPWWMAVLNGNDWVTFQMELGDRKHRKAFLEGRVPAGATVGSPDC